MKNINEKQTIKEGNPNSTTIQLKTIETNINLPINWEIFFWKKGMNI